MKKKTPRTKKHKKHKSEQSEREEEAPPALPVEGATRAPVKDWEMKDFVASVDEVMQKQEKENPAIKQVHARLSPEWNRVSEKIGRLLTLTDEAALERLREEIVAEGEMGTRVLVDLLLTIKNQARSS
ncbi:MAG: hypothetical protein HY877_08875 [Deltaproteobacteria bacterium]|nr:hypothetical protein [Deltaproteobacteria bacterium]